MPFLTTTGPNWYGPIRFTMHSLIKRGISTQWNTWIMNQLILIVYLFASINYMIINTGNTWLWHVTTKINQDMLCREQGVGKRKKNLLRAASIKSEPGNGDPSNAWSLDSTIPFLNLPQKILSKIDAIGSNTGLYSLFCKKIRISYSSTLYRRDTCIYNFHWDFLADLVFNKHFLK